MNKNEIWEQIKNDKTMIYNQSMLEVFLQTTSILELDHYLELDDQQKKLISIGLAYKLAKELYEKTKQRSSDLEKILIKDPLGYAYDYARDIIQGRWPELEPILIKKEPQWAYAYAYNYADEVIKGRWKEAEPIIKKDAPTWHLYKKQFKI